MHKQEHLNISMDRLESTAKLCKWQQKYQFG